MIHVRALFFNSGDQSSSKDGGTKEPSFFRGLTPLSEKVRTWLRQVEAIGNIRTSKIRIHRRCYKNIHFDSHMIVPRSNYTRASMKCMLFIQKRHPRSMEDASRCWISSKTINTYTQKQHTLQQKTNNSYYILHTTLSLICTILPLGHCLRQYRKNMHMTSASGSIPSNRWMPADVWVIPAPRKI